eukprot:gb/GEZN01005047.1/.p1 GENE.gb/GEZN01005047.1/~~gb/GEZN01005047.1/.p1  ORF type:complete len:285 (+),score=37.13 gb/GEZN01005047.1/:140-994(+)
MSTVEYNSARKSAQAISQYTRTEMAPYRYLGFRDIPKILASLLPNSSHKRVKALDYGCGSGYSARFLHSLGMHVTCADINPAFLAQAQTRCHNLDFEYILISDDGRIPRGDGEFDLVFSSFVISELNSEPALKIYIQEGARVLAEDGVFFFMTGKHMWTRDGWTCFDVPALRQNLQARSGERVRVVDPATSIEFVDYYYPEEIIDAHCRSAGLLLVKKNYPLGYPSEHIPWLRELYEAPFVQSVWKKDMTVRDTDRKEMVENKKQSHGATLGKTGGHRHLYPKL